jgi:hypothetical protein
VEEEGAIKEAVAGGAGVPVSAIPSRRVSAPEALGADSLMRVEEAEVRH